MINYTNHYYCTYCEIKQHKSLGFYCRECKKRMRLHPKNLKNRDVKRVE